MHIQPISTTESIIPFLTDDDYVLITGAVMIVGLDRSLESQVFIHAASRAGLVRREYFAGLGPVYHIGDLRCLADLLADNLLTAMCPCQG